MADDKLDAAIREAAIVTDGVHAPVDGIRTGHEGAIVIACEQIERASRRMRLALDTGRADARPTRPVKRKR
jgi:hypothetical protein